MTIHVEQTRGFITHLALPRAPLWRVAPALGLALALGACGGGGGDGVDSDASVTACFTATKTVTFAIKATPPGASNVTRSTVGPMTYRGQAVTGQTWFAGAESFSQYWTVTDAGVTFVADVDSDGTATPSGGFLPKNMRPGQSVTDPSDGSVDTLVGFENITLGGKTFSNTCHFRETDSQGGDALEVWYAPGYGQIKMTDSDATVQYNGDL